MFRYPHFLDEQSKNKTKNTSITSSIFEKYTKYITCWSENVNTLLPSSIYVSNLTFQFRLVFSHTKGCFHVSADTRF